MRSDLIHRVANMVVLIVAGVALGGGVKERPVDGPWPQYGKNPFVIKLEIPPPKDSAGGIIVADVNDDGLIDYVVTVPGHVAAYHHTGKKMWIAKIDVRVGGSSERHGLPGHNGPGVQAGDCDGDGHTEVLFLTQDGKLHVLAGATGKEKAVVTLAQPFKDGMAWQHAILCNLRGKGLRDVIVQTTNKKGYKMGRYMAAYALDAPDKPLWQTDAYLGCAHTGARVADLNGDGLDEVLGATVFGPDGKLLFRLPMKAGHLDSIFVGPIVPGVKTLQIVGLQEGAGNHVFLWDHQKMYWQTHYQHSEPQNAAIGRFDPARKGMQIWCRSRHNEHQKPFVFDAAGKLISHYEMDKVAPKGWTVRGVEVIYTIDWTGGPKQLCAAKERHRSGDVCIFDGVTGQFVHTIKSKADRLYVADVSGDWREEIVVLVGNELRIYHNPAANPQPKRPRLWHQQHYRRSKMTHNYYCP
jgi:hypothetical protein